MSADGNGVPEAAYIHNYLHLIGIVVLYYDFFLTFGEEYARVWKNPRAVSSILFFINRYIPILGDIAVNTGNFYIFPNEQVCRQYAFFRQLLLIINQVVVCFILFLRTYALYGRDKRVLVLVISVGVTLLAIACWAVVGQHETIELRGGCHLESDRLTAIRESAHPWHTRALDAERPPPMAGLAVSWEALFAFDCMIFTLTICKTFRERYRHRISSGKHDIISLILRDGSMYFAVMASVNFANTLTFYFLEPLLRGCLSTFASSVSVTMMSRLMLNLHGSASGRGGALSTSSAYPTASEDGTTMLFTSRISMPPPERAPAPPRPRASAYVRDAQLGHGYIEEVYELHALDDYGGGGGGGYAGPDVGGVDGGILKV
ncbi:hypothetical protein BD413DRAFT_173739 [Trametes elegans]|nr:hypothetical protein BD413DRAFT_173739 [Trametes elegans]